MANKITKTKNCMKAESEKISFRELTYKRRQILSSLWYLDEIVYGEIGPNKTSYNHAFNSHFKQLNASHPNALPEVLTVVKKVWHSFFLNPPVDFEDLFDRVKKILLPIHGSGPLLFYDVSLAIGCNLYPRVLPEKYVYIHQNRVRESARILLKKDLPEKVDAKEFTDLFPNFSAMEIEDILCTYHDEIKESLSFDMKWLNL